MELVRWTETGARPPMSACAPAPPDEYGGPGAWHAMATGPPGGHVEGEDRGGSTG